VHGALNFTANLWRAIGAGGKNQNHHAGFVDRVDDGAAPVRARNHISRGDPAADMTLLEFRANGVGYSFVEVGIADENVVSQRAGSLNAI
jgi:hypothetical protein